MQGKRSTIGLVVIIPAFLIIAFFLGWFSRSRWQVSPGQPMKEIRLGGYDFINPLLECESSGNSMADRELRPFQHKIEAMIDEKKKAKWADHISVYFRDMNNGLTFGIDDREKFSPASLIKIPLMIAYFKWAETEPDILRRKLTFVNLPDMNAPQIIKPTFVLEYGQSYIIEDLLFRTIVYSDNNAYFLLYTNMNQSIQKKVYIDLGLEIPRIRQREDQVTVSEYAAFFRILYNASYLNQKMSEKALEYMSQVDFKQGLIGGLPAGIVASHKFGEASLGESGQIKQLHDCGIIYYPNDPYLLCVMSRGSSFEYLDDSIREISRLVYGEVDRQHGKH